MFANVNMLYLLWALPAMAALYVYASRKRKRALSAFASPQMMIRLADPDAAARRAWKATAACVAAALLVIAMARPAWNPISRDIGRKGRDIVFVIDVSRSMMATDLPPTRLERAKAAVLDCLEELRGDRVALVLFAGAAQIKCPLTLDYNFFRNSLHGAATDSAPVGGTRIGDAILKVTDDLLTEDKSGFQDIILITDGEDHDSDPAEAAEELRRTGTRLIAIGLGDDRLGKRISIVDPDTGRSSFLSHDGQEVWTRLDSATLRSIVDAAPGGEYYHVATGAINLADVYLEMIAEAEQSRFEEQQITRFEDKFQIFLAPAFLLVLLTAAAGERKRPRVFPGSSVGVVIFALLLAANASATSSRGWLMRGAEACEADDYQAASDAYREALTRNPESAAASYNLGFALYKSGDDEAAKAAFENAAILADDGSMSGRAWHSHGNCFFRQADAYLNDDEASMETDFYARLDRLRGAAYLNQQSEMCFRAALDLDPTWRDAAWNLEVARRQAQDINERVEAVMEEQRQLARQLDEIRRKLEELIAREHTVSDETRRTSNSAPVAQDAVTTPPWTIQALATEQRAILDETREVEALMREMSGKLPAIPTFDEDVEDGEYLTDPLELPIEHTVAAITEEDGATSRLAHLLLTDARPFELRAERELRLALDSLPQSAGEEGESQEGEEGEEGENSEESGEGLDAPMSDLAQTEMEQTDLPPPTKTAEEILEEEMRNQQQREKRRSGKYAAVEMDW